MRIFYKILLGVLMLSISLQFANASGNWTHVKFKEGKGVDKIEIKNLKDNDFHFGSTRNEKQSSHSKHKDGYWYFDEQTKYLDRGENAPIFNGFISRFKDGGFGDVGYSRYSSYFVDIQLYINKSRVKGTTSMLISGLDGVFKGTGTLAAILNNNPYGEWLQTENGKKYNMKICDTTKDEMSVCITIQP